MLCEDGEWVWEYLDGSSNEEQMINELAVAGVAQICPAGNLTGGGMQKTIQVAARDSVTVSFTGGASNVAWPSLRWIGGEGDLAIGLQINGGPFVMLPGGGSTVTIGGKQVYSLLGTSLRGTSMMMLRIGSSTSTIDSLRIVNHTGSSLRAEGMLGDDGMGWGGLARWTAPSENNTVTWPATADSAIGVGAYKNKSSNTDINSYSGRGTRIDGRPCVTVAAPGSTVYSIARGVTYTAFGGTSSAGPHVAGGAALLLQADSTLGNGGVRRAIASGALADQFTGPVPNSTWGYGKLRILGALGTVTEVSEKELASPSAYRLEQNYPNPFNPSTTIVWEMPSRGWVQLKVFDLLGREITLLVEGHLEAGRHARTWNARMMASGVYFYRLAIDGRPVSTKPMTLLR
jgi:subtilisin family serine protease